eukprot:gene7208-2683_t
MTGPPLLREHPPDPLDKIRQETRVLWQTVGALVEQVVQDINVWNIQERTKYGKHDPKLSATSRSEKKKTPEK